MSCLLQNTVLADGNGVFLMAFAVWLPRVHATVIQIVPIGCGLLSFRNLNHAVPYPVIARFPATPDIVDYYYLMKGRSLLHPLRPLPSYHVHQGSTSAIFG